MDADSLVLGAKLLLGLNTLGVAAALAWLTRMARRLDVTEADAYVSLNRVNRIARVLRATSRRSGRLSELTICRLPETEEGGGPWGA